MHTVNTRACDMVRGECVMIAGRSVRLLTVRRTGLDTVTMWFGRHESVTLPAHAMVPRIVNGTDIPAGPTQSKGGAYTQGPRKVRLPNVVRGKRTDPSAQVSANRQAPGGVKAAPKVAKGYGV